MRLVEQHVIKKTDSRWKAIDEAAFASKNLYNAANYIVRQEFIHNGQYLNYYELHRQMQETEEYSSLPAKVAQQVLIQLDRNWQSFFAARVEYKEHPDKFFAQPRLPKYKQKQIGRNILIYTIQAISKPKREQGIIKPSRLDIEVHTLQRNVACVRIVPFKTHYVIEVVYNEPESPADVDPSLVASVDVGLNNLAAVASNKPGFVPFLVNGRSLKSTNQFYNLALARLNSQLQDPEQGTSARISRLTDKRNRRIHQELHTASRYVIDFLVKEGLGRLVIGKNPNWKQESNMGKRNNQNFVQMPHARFVQMLTYKAQLVGIQVIETEESYTSKCSFLDLEPIEKHDAYMGRRMKRGLFRASDGRLINADINGAFNIMRKVFPNVFADGIEDVVVHPLRMTCISRKSA